MICWATCVGADLRLKLMRENGRRGQKKANWQLGFGARQKIGLNSDNYYGFTLDYLYCV